MTCHSRRATTAAIWRRCCRLRDIVVFPHMIVPLFVGREKSVRALEEVMSDEKQILLLTQKNKDDDDPTSDALHSIGTLATVLQLLKLPDQTVRVLVEGKGRARVTGFVPRTDFFQATIERIPDSASDAKETEALIRTVKTNFEQYIKLNKKVPAETLASVAQIEDAGQARRHGRLASVGQDRRPPGAAGNARHGRTS